MSEKQLFITGRNWGEVDLNGNMLAFLVGSKQAFEVSLADVSQTQLQGKNYVILEFHMNDITGANEVHDCNSLHRIGRQIIQKTCNAVHSCHISGIQRSVYWDLFLTVRFECMRPIHRSNV